MLYDLRHYIDDSKGNAKEMIELFHTDFQLRDGTMTFWDRIDWLETIYRSQFPVPQQNTWGGKRIGTGKKRIGITKKISLTLTTDQWNRIKESGKSTSEYIREFTHFGML